MTAPSWLVIADVDAIQSYVFSSIRLATIAGASQIVAENDWALRQLGRRHRGTVLFSAGGTAVVCFDTEDRADAFCVSAQQGFKAASRTGRLTTSNPTETSTFARFGDALSAAAESLERRKRLGQAAGELAMPPLGRRCDACGLEPAEDEVAFGVEPLWLGASCRLKREGRDRAGWLRLLQRVDPVWRAATSAHLPQTFDELADEGYLAVVVADVNSVGERLRRVASARDYMRFSSRLRLAVERAVSDALDAAGTSVKGQISGGEVKLPFEVLWAGGDDLVVACQGERALPFVSKLVESFSTRANGAWTLGDPLGLSAAVVVTRVGFPFRASYRIAERLLKAAKRDARLRGWQEGAVDFVIVTEAHGDAEVILADRVIESGDGKTILHLTGRPYSAAACGERSLISFRAACRSLSTKRGATAADGAVFPRSKLFDLRGLSTARRYLAQGAGAPSSADVEGFRNRLKEELIAWRMRVARDPQILQLWEDVENVLGMGANGMLKSDAWRTPAGDLAEAVVLWGGAP